MPMPTLAMMIRTPMSAMNRLSMTRGPLHVTAAVALPR
jgi:hypothetical protein